MDKPKDRDEFIEKLQHQIAGETINWRSYERFNIGGLPKTMKTLMKVEKAEAYMEAVQDKFQMSKGLKISLASVFIIVVIIMIVLVVGKNMGFF